MKKLLILIPIILCGCASVEPQIQIQKVEVPVLKNCYGDKNIPEKPILMTDSLSEKEPLDIWANGALKDVNNLKVYSDTLRTFICD